MSHLDLSVSNAEVIPVFESPLFETRPDARFALGTIAVGDTVLPDPDTGHMLDDEVSAYFRLRANVYGPQTRMLADDEIQRDHTGDIVSDYDRDDVRSIHMGLYENVGNHHVRAVGAMRLIVKSAVHSDALPVEDFFPEAFPKEAPLTSIEVSRYIARHEKARVQDMLSDPIFAAALHHIVRKGLGPTYATVEPFLEAKLAQRGVPVTRIAEPKYVPEYNDTNLGLVIDTDKHMANMTARAPELVAALDAADGGFIGFGRYRAIMPVDGAA